METPTCMRLQKKKQGCRGGATRSKNEAQRGKKARERRMEKRERKRGGRGGGRNMGRCWLEERARWKRLKPEERRKGNVLVNHEVAYLTKNKTEMKKAQSQPASKALEASIRSFELTAPAALTARLGLANFRGPTALPAPYGLASECLNPESIPAPRGVPGAAPRAELEQTGAHRPMLDVLIFSAVTFPCSFSLPPFLFFHISCFPCLVFPLPFPPLVCFPIQFFNYLPLA